MIQKIYNALRQCEGYTKIDVGDGVVYKVWLDWKNQPYADFSRDENDSTVGMEYKWVINEAKFESSKHLEGFKREVIPFSSIKKINYSPIEERIAS